FFIFFSFDFWMAGVIGYNKQERINHKVQRWSLPRQGACTSDANLAVCASLLFTLFHFVGNPPPIERVILNILQPFHLSSENSKPF
ncbi:MAG TPA: hypothetical protein VNA23_07790, partial [Anaerolineales bacterium]|nr:hypothetical protein [Anaerolineales bacterium]